MEKKEEYIIGETGFWAKWGSKLLFTLISVKVWGLIGATWISTWLLLNHDVIEVGGETFEFGINGGQWMTFNTTIWALIFGMKEVFRISDKRDSTEKETLSKQLESKQKLATIISSSRTANPKAVTQNPDGTETVGSEPD